MFGAPLRAPRGALPLPVRHSARPQGGAALPPPLGAGVRFIPSGCSQAAPPSSSPSWRGLPSYRRFAPAEAGERSVCAHSALPALFSFPRGVRRCGAPPSSGRRYAPPPSCAFSLPSARVSLPPFLPRVLSPFRECSCGVLPMRREVPMRREARFARCLARRVPRRFARSRVSCRASRAGWCLCPRAVPASGQGHA